MKIILIKPYFDYPAGCLPEVEFYMKSEECREAEAIIGFPSNVGVDVLEGMPKLKWIQLLSAGYDDVNLNYIKDRGIVLTNARGVYSVPIAEDVVCRILMANCNVLHYVSHMKGHIWAKAKKRTELMGQTVGIIGTGSIGCEIASRLKPFGVKVLGFRRTALLPPDFDEVLTGDDGLARLLSESDYVVVAADLNSGTEKLLNCGNMKFIKDGASIINIARGSIIDQEYLKEMLLTHRIGYAGLDVFEDEPLGEDDGLWDLDNVYITPHCSGTVTNNRRRVEELIVSNVRRYINGVELQNVVRLDSLR